MFIYETGPLDWFDGMVPVCKAIRDAQHQDRDDSALEIVSLMMLCAYKVARATSWEGDIRDDNIYLFSLPDPDFDSTRMGLIWKQDNNGSTFTCSPVEIPWLKEYLVKTTD